MTAFPVSAASAQAGTGVALRPTRFMIGAAVALAGGVLTLNTAYYSGVGELTLIRLDRLRASDRMVTSEGQPTSQFQQFYQKNVEQTERAIRALAAGQIDLRNIVDILLATQKAAGAATIAAEAAQAKAAATDDYNRVRDSYSDPGVLSAANAGGVVTISIAMHQRHYLDPAKAIAVNDGEVSGQPAATVVFVYYDDPALAGGAVAYAATPDEAASVATLANPYRHRVGSITTPAQTGQGTEGNSSIPPWKLEARDDGPVVAE